ncbi:MAG TPA: hypothetical protein VL283_00910, partial [Candidatus Baltobacteraceae bacterium]|nr:hypothetical protein [Candidatus Baltobacteraceae bacterium]
MHLNQAQQKILIGVQEDPRVLSHFEVLCAEFEAALDEDERPQDLEKTDPFGVVTIHSAADRLQVEITEAATVIAVAWLEMIASAIMEQDGVIDPLLFDEDGVSVFGDTRPL